MSVVSLDEQSKVDGEPLSAWSIGLDPDPAGWSRSGPALPGRVA